ncbi:hypothetical protein [Photobacterium damselae]|uniref:Uncharacterized protein n=1 Tax=Photobacterium damselae subsp. damselae TaxID=85581 RepID=A0AAD3WYB0_PHODD|nr:hypothetical protein [Photobacterium damselae]KAB1184211.1 hypothetical protein F6450_02570 [Photobacterium damselae subsp. damselae]
MYSDTIKSKIDKMFSDLRDEVQESIDESFPSNDMVNIVCGRVRSEMESRSKTMLSDMLFELNDSVLQTSFFADNMAGQNAFLTHNLRQEVLTKYQFSTTSTINYQETSLVVGSVKVGGGVLAVGGVCEIGIVLIEELSFSSLVPIPVGMLFALAFGAAIADYFFIKPNRNKKQFFLAIDEYFSEAKEQYINWFDEIENYFNKRVNEIKQMIRG